MFLQREWKGPYQFHACQRLCPECRSLLVTQESLGLNMFRGIYQDLGVTCHCVSCNTRFRAFGRKSFSKIFRVMSFLGLFFLAKKLWWKDAHLEKILQYTG